MGHGEMMAESGIASRSYFILSSIIKKGYHEKKEGNLEIPNSFENQ
jgi:hypothetical protein